MSRAEPGASSVAQQGSSRPDSAGDLKRTFEQIIASVDLGHMEREWLRSRWLARSLRLRKNADGTRQWFYWLRGTAIVSSLIVPALVSLNLSGDAAFWIRVMSIVLSLIAAISAAVLELFRFGPRWRLYREYAERLVSEGWKFFELRKPYAVSHQQAFDSFVGEVEDLLSRYESAYIKDVIPRPGEESPRETETGSQR
jgi:hypothetical protein